MPVSDGLADFLALGCRLPGEVRISHSRDLNIINLRPVKLIRTPIGDGPDFNVEVAFNGEDSPAPPTRSWTPWLKHEESPYHSLSSTTIEKKLHSCIKKDKSLLESLKKRPLPHPLTTGSATPPFSPIKFKSDSKYEEYIDNRILVITLDLVEFIQSQ